MDKKQFKLALISGLIMVVLTCLIIYIYNPYRIESTIDYSMTKYFDRHERINANLFSVSEKMRPLYEKQYDRAVDIMLAQSEDEAREIMEDVEKMGMEMEEIFNNSKEYGEIMKLDEEVTQLQNEINYNLDQLDEETKDSLLDKLAEKNEIGKTQLIELLSANFGIEEGDM